MASLFQVLDLDDAISEGTQHVAGGFEAPRNSLDEASSLETSYHKPEDIPFGYGCYNPASDGRWKRDGREEKKRRAPNVVARLMGLDAMPDDLPTRNPSQAMPKYRCEGGNAPVLKLRAPVRDHPQEAELQRFKKEFQAKQQLDDMNRQLEEKKRKVRATLDKARLALSQGIITEHAKHGKFEESKEFLEALEFLQCNKDFIFQFLQQKPHVVFSNNESFNATATPVTTHPKKGKHATPATQASRDSTERGFSPRALARLFMPSDSSKRNDHNKQQPPAIEGLVTHNPTATHRPGSRDLISENVKRRTSTSTSSRYMLPSSPKAQIKPSRDEGRGAKARDVIMEIKERLRRREQQSGEEVQYTKALRKHEQLRDSKACEAGSSQKTSNFTVTKSLSTGKRISMMRPDMDDMSDGEEISTPKALLTDSPATIQAKATKKKTYLALESSMKPMRRSAENATRSNASPSKKLLHSVNDPASSSNLTRCRSVPNVALLRERGPCTTGIDIAKNATSPKVPKPARNTQNGDQRTLGFFSVGRKMGSRAGHESPQLPSPSRAAAHAESCVLRSNAGCKDGKDSKTKVRRNILDNVKDGRDSNGHPNPVSVWESPGSSPGPPEFKDITNDLQDPRRIRLRHPKLNGSSKRVRDNELDATRERQLNQLDGSSERVRDNKLDSARERHRDTRRAEVPHQSLTRTSSTQIKAERPLHFPPSPATDFTFVRDILVASGFHTHGGRNITRWHSATQPISPHLMKKVEGSRSSRSSHQRTLFDAINEVLIAKLELSSVLTPVQCYGLPIIGVPSSAVSGRRFVEDVWGEIHKRQFPAARCQDSYLQSLVAQELRTSSWMSLRRDVDRIRLQLEKAIWNDLMEELCGGLLSVN